MTVIVIVCDWPAATVGAVSVASYSLGVPPIVSLGLQPLLHRPALVVTSVLNRPALPSPSGLLTVYEMVTVEPDDTVRSETDAIVTVGAAA
ncbi:hypothetical protein [Actinoplanes sp. CA-252034]|uniref:hypothetical protein n=1 Tax=Actinoplanes sp. CA-252034 TaxID=3239906 RepID=UPI003D958219